MITPYSPPLGPRIESLRVRRVDATKDVEPSGPSPLRDPGDVAMLPRADRATFSAEALRRLAEDQSLDDSADPQTTGLQENRHGRGQGA